MLTWVLIGVPVFFVVAGTLGALSFAVGAGPENEQPAEQPVVARRPGAIIRPAVAHPLPMVLDEASAREDSELVIALERRLAHERAAATAFARNPSSQTLWLH